MEQPLGVNVVEAAQELNGVAYELSAGQPFRLYYLVKGSSAVIRHGDVYVLSILTGVKHLHDIGVHALVKQLSLEQETLFVETISLDLLHNQFGIQMFIMDDVDLGVLTMLADSLLFWNETWAVWYGIIIGWLLPQRGLPLGQLEPCQLATHPRRQDQCRTSRSKQTPLR